MWTKTFCVLSVANIHQALFRNFMAHWHLFYAKPCPGHWDYPMYLKYRS